VHGLASAIAFLCFFFLPKHLQPPATSRISSLRDPSGHTETLLRHLTNGKLAGCPPKPSQVLNSGFPPRPSGLSKYARKTRNGHCNLPKEEIPIYQTPLARIIVS